MKEHFWWNGMKILTVNYVSRWLEYQQVKTEYERLGELIQPLSIPEWKFEKLTMYFVTALRHNSKGNNATWVIIDCLIKSVYFIPFCANQSMKTLAYLERGQVAWVSTEIVIEIYQVKL